MDLDQKRRVDFDESLARARQSVVSTRDLHRAGMTGRGIAAAVRSGSLTRLRTGWFVPASGWEAVKPDARHLAAVVAAQRVAPSRIVFSHRSAATLHRLPVWSRWLADEPGSEDERWLSETRVVHTTVASGARRVPEPSRVRHRESLSADDIVRVDGFECTSLERTLFDIARSEPFPIALACADEALRREVRCGRLVDRERWAAWRERILGRVRAYAGRPGSRAVRALALLADPRVDSPLESGSRLRFLQVGIEVELQHEVIGADGRRHYLDFWLKHQNLFGECDGKIKYSDVELRHGRSAGDVFFAEKLRQDAVSGAIMMRGVRWAARHVVTGARFAAHLRSLGVEVPGRASHAFGADVASFLDMLP